MRLPFSLADELPPGLRSPALRFSVAYLLFGAAWFVLSHQLHDHLATGRVDSTRIDLLLEAVFVGASALSLFVRNSRQAQQDGAAPGRAWIASPTIAMGLLLFLFAIASLGTGLYLSFRDTLASRAKENLEGAAKLKVAWIEAWLADARDDTLLALNTPEFIAELGQWQNGGRRDDARRERLLTRLQALQIAGHFRHVALYDAAGAPLLSTALQSQRPLRGSLVQTAAQWGEAVLEDFTVADGAGGSVVNVGFVLPLNAAAAGRTTALAHVALDPERRLYPQLQNWLGSSISAEILLVRRDNDDWLILNSLRQRSDPPLSLRLPSAASGQLVARLLDAPGSGGTGFDYRNRSCLGYALPVAGTSWQVVAKVDEDEVYGTLNAIATIAAAIIAIKLLVVMLWLNDHCRSQAARLMLSQRIELLVKHANDNIILLDAGNRIIDVNDHCLRSYGYSRAEMLTMNCASLQADARTGGDSIAPHNDRRRENWLPRASHHRRKDGSVFPVEVSMVTVDVGGALCTQQIIRDISEQEQRNADILGLSRLCAALSAVSQMVARSNDIEQLFRTACRVCVEQGGLVLAWIGVADPDGEHLLINHCYGDSYGYLEGTRICIHPDALEAQSPAGIAFLQQRSQISNDISSDPATALWRNQVAGDAIRATISLPILRDGVVVGVLSAYSDKANLFDTQVAQLLKEISSGLSFAMCQFAEHEAKLKIEAELRQSEELLHEAQGIARIGHWQYDLETEAWYWSPEMYRLFERDPALGPAAVEELDTYYSRSSAKLLRHHTRHAMVTGKRVELELEIALPGQRVGHQAAVLTPVRDDLGRTIKLRGTFQDITERKLNEQRIANANKIIRDYARNLEDLYQNAPCGYHSLDKAGIFQRINDEELKWLGYSRDEVVGKKRFVDLLTPECVPNFHQTFPRLMEFGEIHDLEMDLVGKTGNIVPVLLSATTVRDREGGFVMTRSTLFNMTERKKLEKEREEYLRRLNNLSHRLVSAQENGRRMLSAALHDQTSPNLAAIDINLKRLAKRLPQDCPLHEVSELLADTSALLEDTTIRIREICAELRPSLLDYAGLVPALEGYLQQYSRRTGIAVHFNCACQPGHLGKDKEALLFRVVQEALTNSAKHAQASLIEVALKEDDDGAIVLSIVDDGLGFDPELIGRDGGSVGQGVLNMREISEYIGGMFAIDSTLGKGTSVSVAL